MAAAQSSGGTSSNTIYDLVLRAATEFSLGGDLLDFGAGTGQLTERLLKSARFGSVAAADLLERPETLPGCVEWLNADLNEPLPYCDASFDTVVAAEVIEHLENPRSVAREMNRLLRPGGALILTTPNNESFRSLIFLALRGYHVAFGPGSYPAHITPLLRVDLTRVLTETGFDTPVFRYTDTGGLPGHPQLSWQKISAGALRGVRFSDNLLAFARKLN